MFHGRYAHVTVVLRRGVVEAVADAPDGLHPGRGDAGGGELAPQPGDVDVHRAWLHEAVAAPHGVEQLVAREHAARRGGQQREDVELAGGQRDDAPLHAHLEALPIDLEVADLDLDLAPDRIDASAARDRADPGDELARREGLGHVVVGADLEAEDLVTLLDAAGDHDDGNGAGLGVLLEATADLPAVQLGHHDVEQDEVGARLVRLPDGLGASGGDDDVVTFLAEVVAEELRDVALVLDDEHATGGMAGRSAFHVAESHGGRLRQDDAGVNPAQRSRPETRSERTDHCRAVGGHRWAGRRCRWYHRQSGWRNTHVTI